MVAPLSAEALRKEKSCEAHIRTHVSRREMAEAHGCASPTRGKLQPSSRNFPSHHWPDVGLRQRPCPHASTLEPPRSGAGAYDSRAC